MGESQPAQGPSKFIVRLHLERRVLPMGCEHGLKKALYGAAQT